MKRLVLLSLSAVALAVAMCLCVLSMIIVRDMVVYGVPMLQSQNEVQRDAPDTAEAQTQAPEQNTPAEPALLTKHACRACHGPAWAGQKLGAMTAPGLRPTDPFGTWSEAEFMAAMRNGRRPNGSTLSDVMPWRAIGKANDAGLKAMYAYLKAVQ